MSEATAPTPPSAPAPAPSGPGRRRWLVSAWVLGGGLSLLVPIAGRVLVDGRAELAAAAEARAAGDGEAEIRHLGRAARFRLPLADHDERALARLAELGRGGDSTLALTAWRELRGALIGTRVVGVSDPGLLAEADAAIVERMADEAARAGAPVARERWAAELDEDLEPRSRSLLAATALVAWLGACVGLVVRGIDRKGRLDPVPARRWGVAVLLTLIAWIAWM